MSMADDMDITPLGFDRAVVEFRVTDQVQLQSFEYAMKWLLAVPEAEAE